MQCRYCNSDKITKNGHDSKRNQRYKCKECDKTFSLNSKSRIPFEFISMILDGYVPIKGERSYFPSYVNRFLKLIGYKPVHRTTIYSWIRKYNKRELIPFEDALKWFQQHIKKIKKNHPKSLNKLTRKEKIHRQYPIDKLLGTHTEALKWIHGLWGTEIYKIMEKYRPELIEEMFDHFHAEKYLENRSEIDAIYYANLKKRILSDK